MTRSRHACYRIGRSATGLGLFAIAPIRRGAFIVEYSGERIPTREAKAREMTVLGIVGRNGGYTMKVGDSVVVIPTVSDTRVTPHTEAFQAVVWHCLVSHPGLQQVATKW